MVWWDSWFRCVCAPVNEAKDTCIMSEEVIVARESENLTGTIKVSGAKKLRIEV